jgi:hypothetical protein
MVMGNRNDGRCITASDSDVVRTGDDTSGPRPVESRRRDRSSTPQPTKPDPGETTRTPEADSTDAESDVCGQEAQGYFRPHAQPRVIAT